MEQNKYTPRDYERKATQRFLTIVLGIVLFGVLIFVIFMPTEQTASEEVFEEDTVLAYNSKEAEKDSSPTKEEIEVETLTKEDSKPVEQPKTTTKKSKAKSTRTTGIDEAQALVLVDEMATPQHGFEAYYRYIRANMEYPTKAIKEGIEGKVTIEFIVDKTGNLHNIKVKRGLGHGCDEAALRVVKEGEKWKPAKNKGELVMQKITLPISFKLSSDAKPIKN
jgi:periplasmic protein TonB